MYLEGGHLYIYFVYGMHWMLNVVTGPADHPQAVLIRGVSQYQGPGRVTKGLGVDGSFNREDLASSGRIWIEDTGFRPAKLPASAITCSMVRLSGVRTSRAFCMVGSFLFKRFE